MMTSLTRQTQLVESSLETVQDNIATVDSLLCVLFFLCLFVVR